MSPDNCQIKEIKMLLAELWNHLADSPDQASVETIAECKKRLLRIKQILDENAIVEEIEEYKNELNQFEIVFNIHLMFCNGTIDDYIDKLS